MHVCDFRLMFSLKKGTQLNVAWSIKRVLILACALNTKTNVKYWLKKKKMQEMSSLFIQELYTTSTIAVSSEREMF